MLLLLENMMRVSLSVLFLTAVVCLTSGQEHNGRYSTLDPGLKKFVDLAINEANQRLNFGHLNFNEIGEFAQVTPRVRIDVRLKNTQCTKASGAKEHRHRPSCPFKQLQVRCLVCSPNPNTSDPFIDCVRKKDQRQRYATWGKHCTLDFRLPGMGGLMRASRPIHNDDNPTTMSLTEDDVIPDEYIS